MQSQVKTASATVEIGYGNDENMMEAIRQGGNQLKAKSEEVRLIEEKQREIEKLKTLMEAIEPIPGFDIDVYKRLILASGDNSDVDYRDKKIVELAKKSRNLTLHVTKQQTEIENLRQNLREASVSYDSLKEEMKLLQKQKPASQQPTQAEVDAEQMEMMQKELNSANRTVEEQRRKMNQLKEESKNYKAALTRELGEGVTLDQALDGNWRGRAQQIVMLKAKVKRLEATLSDKPKRGDVDVKAENVIADMEESRKQAIEAVTADYNNVVSQKKELEQRVQSQKARIKNLEGDVQQQKMEIQVVLDKTKSDDELIDLLKAEVHRLKDVLATVMAKHAQEKNAKQPQLHYVNGNNNQQQQQVSESADMAELKDETQRLKREVNRLDRLNRNQSEQLQTQDKIIRELRAQLQSY